MLKCDNCGEELKEINNSKYLVCIQCGLVSNIIIFSTVNFIKDEENKQKFKRNNLYFSKIFLKLKIPLKYKNKINNKILYQIRDKKIKSRKEIIKIIRNEIKDNSLINKKIIKEAKKYINIIKVFLNYSGIEEIFLGVAIIFYCKRNNVNISFETVAKFLGISKNNLFRRYKEFEKRIKLYTNLNFKKALILKIIGQKRFKNLSLKDISLIYNKDYQRLKKTYLRLHKKLKSKTTEEIIKDFLVNNAGGGI
jgi:transcription initiation factor TFIIIB Brf1 subunit/transcription initiation factor TFIIB